VRKNSIIVFGIHKGNDELRWNRTDLKELGYSPSSVFGSTITPFFHLRISRKKLKMKFFFFFDKYAKNEIITSFKQEGSFLLRMD
jgi:hypothetical protein